MKLYKSSIIDTYRNILPVYLLLYFLFISNYFKFSFPVITFIVDSLQYISGKLMHLVNAIFIHKQFDGNITMDDNYWLYIAVVTYFALSIFIGVIWTIVAGSKGQAKLFSYLNIYSRYYLAFMMLHYGFAKIFGNQFAEPWPNDLIQPLANLNVHSLLWDFMGASRSYNFFAGLLEVIPGALLLFRKTSVIGAIASIAVLLNVLMLNIGYDVQVKTMTLHLILIGIFILHPDADRLLKFFFLNADIQKKRDMPIIEPKFRRALFTLKFILIAYVFFVYVNDNLHARQRRTASMKSVLNGIYEINGFQNTNEKMRIDDGNSKWTKLAMMNGYATIRFSNDSTSVFIASIDTTKKIVELKSPYDSLFKSSLHFIQNSDQYNFKGVFGVDSVYVSAKKIDIEKMPLNKDRGKIQWLWY